MYIENKLLAKNISYWLSFMFFIVSIMIIVGGLTRLTDSGLSITQWQLFSGVLPPLNDFQWNKYFDLYKEHLTNHLDHLLIYLNSNWDAKWGGAIEFWDKKMSSAQASISPEINNAAIFRTDKNSNHGFPDPIKCPDDITRKSIALYYYVEEKSFFPITLKRTKYFHAVWKRRPNIEEPRFADDHKSLFKKMKLRFFYRFF